MAAPTTAGEIYDRLVADATISAALGTYTLSDGTTRPAIRVAYSTEPIPDVARAGVEVVIRANPTPEPEPTLGYVTLLNPLWRLYVVQWDPAGGLAQCWPIVQRVIALLPGATATPIDLAAQREAGQEAFGILDQYAVRWTDPTAHVVTPEVMPEDV